MAYTLFSSHCRTERCGRWRAVSANVRFWATVLFLAVPAFVVNGNSLEADLPFLAFFLAAIALFIRAVDQNSRSALFGAGVSAALSALAAYQAVSLVPILGLYLLQHRRRQFLEWAVVLAGPAAIGAWLFFERATSGQLPVAVLAGLL